MPKSEFSHFFLPQLLVELLTNLVYLGKKPIKVVEEEEEEVEEESEEEVEDDEDDKPVKGTTSQNCNDYPQF
jgi:hypothetical protein